MGSIDKTSGTYIAVRYASKAGQTQTDNNRVLGKRDDSVQKRSLHERCHLALQVRLARERHLLDVSQRVRLRWVLRPFKRARGDVHLGEARHTRVGAPA